MNARISSENFAEDTGPLRNAFTANAAGLEIREWTGIEGRKAGRKDEGRAMGIPRKSRDLLRKEIVPLLYKGS